jgi:hypothetical protein
MPHTLQTVRQFWQSQRPLQLETYLRNAGLNGEANQLRACGPGNVATLDPPPLMSSLTIP